MHTRCVVSLLALLAFLALSRPAVASVDLGVGADWIKNARSEFNLTLGVDKALARFISIGGRAGAAFFENSDKIGVPVDLKLGIHIQKIYFEGLIGPWMIFDASDLFYLHVAFGFGLESRVLAGGLEVGRLDHATMVGFRLMIKL